MNLSEVTTEQLRAELKSRGFQTDNLWCLDDVESNTLSNEELSGQRLATYLWNNYRTDIYSAKYYSICNGHKGAVGVNSKSRKSKIQFESGNCPLTGYSMDNHILTPMWEFIDKPDSRDFKELISDCFDAWVKGCNDDIDFQNSDEYIKDAIIANEYEFEFDEDGNME